MTSPVGVGGEELHRLDPVMHVRGITIVHLIAGKIENVFSWKRTGAFSISASLGAAESRLVDALAPLPASTKRFQCESFKPLTWSGMKASN